MKRALAMLLLALLLAGCTGASAAPPRPESVDDELVRATDQFGVSLLRAVYAEKQGKNLFLSPLSASVVLSLTANGARGETQREMLAALGYGEMDLAAVNGANQALQGLLADPDPKVELSLANAVWYQSGQMLAPGFAEVAEGQYRARLQEAEFGDPKAVEEINRWVAEKTRGRIPKLLESTKPDDRMVLVNAIYFKGAWQEPFDANRTRERPFRKADGTQKQVPFMHREATFGYLRDAGLTAVRLPYGEGGLSLYAFMPDDWEGFLDELTPERYREWIAAMGQRRIRLAFPKVKLDDSAELADSLVSLGMKRAFDPDQADFSGLFAGTEPLYISRVVQKTFLEINEEGTEAAAATGVVVSLTSVRTDQPPEVVLDRPFLLAIRDDRTGVTLFMGVILEP